MDRDPSVHQPEVTSNPEPTLQNAMQIFGASPNPNGQKRTPSPTNNEPSKRARTDGDVAGSSGDNQQLGNKNETSGVGITNQAQEVTESPDKDTEDAQRIRLPYGFPPLSPNKLQELREWLASHANLKGDDQVAIGDLEEVCRMVGVNTDDIDWRDGIHIPGVIKNGLKARPHQIAGANWISTTLESPLRAALLADECGTGKTVQIGLALAIHYYRVKAEVDAGTFRPRDERRTFKPSIILCPPDLAYQTFKEWSDWFPNFFNIRICHRTKFLTGDLFTRMHIMDHSNGLQTWVNQNAASHEDIETLRNIAIVPYHTAMRRIILRRDKEDDSNAEDSDVDGNGNGPSNGTGSQVQVQSGRRRRKTTAKEKIEFKWPFVFEDTNGDIEAQAYFDPEAWQAIQDGGEFQGLSIDHIVQPNHAIDPLSARDQLIKEEYIRYIREKNGPLFLMNPDLFQKFREVEFERPEIAREAIRPLLEMFCLRRGMLTPAIMPDGTSVVPGEGMPQMRIRTVIVQSYNNHDQQDLYQIVKHHYPDLFAASNEDDEHIGHGTVDKAKLTWVNPAVLRTLALATTNVEFWPLTQKRGEDGKTTFLNSKPVQKLMSKPPHFDRLQSFSRPGAAAPTAAADSENLEEILWRDGVGGLRWYFGQLKLAYPSDGLGFPQTREEIPKTFCSRSPKLCWAIDRVLELKAQGKRVLIFVNHPLTSTILTALLTSLCVETLNIRSCHTVDQRARMVREFNNPRNRAEALVMSYQLGGFGLNLQGACHHGIIVEYPENLPTMLHSFGRLWRMGQDHEVHWDLLYLKNSFDGWTETRMVSKYADILAAEGEIPDIIQKEYRVICAFELVKRYLGQDSNRYPRTRVTWSEQDHPLVAREGHFYSAVAQYLMLNPSHITKFLARRLYAIARRWTPEHGELTLDMIEGRSPDLEDGVILDSRNPHTPGYIAVTAGDDLEQELEQVMEIQSNLKVDESRLDRERERRI
ncbi:hypothetical protein FGADI_918 [Fusarium gaditjirri]|uniref:Helicase C-terminal domain-containing protein n=1 Tax=Fusarium gaditjirri TaxID=282569 RepID=A0A8H4X4B4_9HYPO|nr:hypothetical protein FGADI_918 [Fusarium gaditjirri]